MAQQTRKLSNHPLITALYNRRVALKMSREDLAARVGATAAQIGDWEAGMTMPRFVSLYCWANSLDMEIYTRPINLPAEHVNAAIDDLISILAEKKQ